MIVRHFLKIVYLVILLSSLYFLKHPYLPKEPHPSITTSQSFPSVLMSLWILCFFLFSLHWGQCCRQCFIVRFWFPHAAFSHVGCWLFLDIKYPWVSLECLIHILLSLTLYCLQLLWAHSFFNAWFNLV